MAVGEASFLHSLTRRSENSGSSPRPTNVDKHPNDDISQQLREMSRRVRILEERNTTLRKNLQVTEQNMLTDNKKLTNEVRAFSIELDEVRKEINELRDHMHIFERQMQETAKSEEVKVLEKYINLWEPLNFVTRKEVEKVVKEILDKEDDD